jgi:predicted GNAT superfamily acetyltransferase
VLGDSVIGWALPVGRRKYMDSTEGSSKLIFSVRAAVELRDYIDCEKVQLEAWGRPLGEIVPVNILRPISEEGGLVLNAYDEDGSPIGTCVSFLGRHAGKPILYSKLLGIIPRLRSRGIGLALKLRQRQYAIEQGFELVCWTYDPMQSVNNWFNLMKLGVVAKTYYANYYGSRADKLNEGLETDRFLAEWWILSPRVTKRTHSGAYSGFKSTRNRLMVVNPTTSKNGTRVPGGEPNLDADDEAILIEIPYEHDRVRRIGHSLLQYWREYTRRTYRHYLGRGYIATGSIVEQGIEQRSFVRLERSPLERILQD